MKDRVLKVRKEAGLNQEDFAKKINPNKRKNIGCIIGMSLALIVIMHNLNENYL